jgi:hypothetical protein
MRSLVRGTLLVLLLTMVLPSGYVFAEQGESSRDPAHRQATIKGTAGSGDFSASPSMMLAQASEKSAGESRRPAEIKMRKKSTGGEGKALETERVWRSDDLDVLGIGMGVGDVDGSGQNDIVIISPSTVYLYRLKQGRLELVTEYSAGSLELKAVDVAKIRKQGPCRIYVTAQNRGALASFVLEYRHGTLEPVIQDIRYYLRVIHYPTQGPILVGQQKGLSKMYEGPIYRLDDKGSELEARDRFGIPLKIPVFGFAVGDLEGNRNPLIAVYDKEDHLRIYTPAGKRLFASKDYYGGSDVILRWGGPEDKRDKDGTAAGQEQVFMRPRIMCLHVNQGSAQEILVTSHSSKTGRYLARTRMLEDGRVAGLAWNGDATDEKWRTPPLQGMVTDFAVDFLPGLAGRRLIVLERKKTDWLSFLRSKSQVKAYDLHSIVQGGAEQKDSGSGESPEDRTGKR